MLSASETGEVAAGPPRRPVIGITTYVAPARWGPWDLPAVLVPQGYVDAVTASGGRPVLLPPSPAAADSDAL
ncbi:MAG TPA: gamma-glutamyl-gamma-aminobutyrate hydrolase family protein, partial [Solirubrobacteraceae bacterium]|nr:gamma-glutamyl-gamma-aminobutyrate hydrolase family protein [Solirubrobacteraceae bacterium]